SLQEAQPPRAVRRHLRRSLSLEPAGRPNTAWPSPCPSKRNQGRQTRSSAHLWESPRFEAGGICSSRDEQEVAGYAEVMELVFRSWQDITITENHIKQLHRDLLIYSKKDARHRGEYKTSSNSVAAFDKTGKHIGIVFATATPFDTPRLMTELIT